MTASGLWLLSRPGFENEAGREWVDQPVVGDIHCVVEPLPGVGLTRVELPEGKWNEASLRRTTPVGPLVFVRDAVFELGRVESLPKQDRVGAVVSAMAAIRAKEQWGEVVVHVPEGRQDKDLSGFARQWTGPVASALRRGGWLASERYSDARRLDLILLDFDRLIIGESYPGHRAAFPGGRPRLRLSPDAPSRAVLKIEEAFLTLLSDKERDRWLVPGRTAVDLGASPGGWTFFLVRKQFSVTAIDNGPMDAKLMNSGRVAHLETDGYTWLPDEPCDWMVCDIVDKPRRTVDLVGRWFRGGHCRASVFNLKLPMKRRLEEWYLCRERLGEALAETGRSFEIRAKQLYHDREEVTVVVLPR